MVTPKVFIGVPCGEFVRGLTAAAICDLVVQSPVDCGLKWGFAGDVAENQNLFAHWALATESTHLLLIETDMLFPANALSRMLARDKAIVGVNYRHREPPFGLMVAEGELFVPSGLMLIQTQVFEKLRCPWFWKKYTSEPNYIVTSDVNFCNAALAAGFEGFLDEELSEEVQHLATLPLRKTPQ